MVICAGLISHHNVKATSHSEPPENSALQFTKATNHSMLCDNR